MRNKKLENELFRIKKQMTKILNEKTSFSNSYMDIKRSENMGHVAQIWDKYRAKGNVEFVEMLKNGFDSTYSFLVDENSLLKSKLTTAQQSVKDLEELKTQLMKELKSKPKSVSQK